MSGSADVGVVALSLALSPNMKDKGPYFDVPAALLVSTIPPKASYVAHDPEVPQEAVLTTCVRSTARRICFEDLTAQRIAH
jgi:hypothetical protein